MSKVGERPTIRIPVFEVQRTNPVTDRFQSFRPNENSTFDRPTPQPMVMPQPPPAVRGYGTPQALDDIFESMKNLPGLQAGATEQARLDAVAQVRDALIAGAADRGLTLSINVKANGKNSIDALRWHKPDGSIAIIDFALASKDLNRTTTFQWLDVTNGGGAPNASNSEEVKNFVRFMMEEAIERMGDRPGTKKGATREQRNAAMASLRDGAMAQARAAGMDVSLNLNENGEPALDELVWNKPDGTRVVMSLSNNANDLNQDLNIQWEPTTRQARPSLPANAQPVGQPLSAERQASLFA